MGDFSPLLPLTAKDQIYLEVFKAEFDRLEHRKHLVFEDILFFVAHSGFSTLTQSDLVKLPSKQAELAEGFRKLKGL